MGTVLEYTDYRAYLRDVIQQRRERNAPASNRWFARKMGINSNAWLTYILQGKRNLTSTTANQLSVILKHSPLENRYFENLVLFNQASTLDEKNSHFRTLSTIRLARDARRLGCDQYEFYSDWRHSAVRSIIDMLPGFRDFEELGRLVSPPISAAEAKKSVALLERLELIRRDERGRYHLSDKVITSGPHEKSLAIANFQRETMMLAHEALDRYPRMQRDISTMTVGISSEALEKIRLLLEETRRKIAAIAAEDDGSDRVYQLNLQLFPLSQPLPRGEC